MIILANTRVLHNETNKCDNYIKDFENNIKNIEKTTIEIGNIWKEAEYENFLSKMNEFIKEMNSFQKQVTSFNEFVKGYVEAEETLDTQYTNKKINIE